MKGQSWGAPASAGNVSGHTWVCGVQSDLSFGFSEVFTNNDGSGIECLNMLCGALFMNICVLTITSARFHC